MTHRCRCLPPERPQNVLRGSQKRRRLGVDPLLLSSRCLDSRILRHSKVSLRPMTMIFRQKMIQSLRHICRDVRLVALLTHIRGDICDHNQLSPPPDLQRGRARP